MDTVQAVIFPFLTILVGAACILLFGVTTTLRATNEDQGNRIKFLEDERKRDKETLDARDQAIKALNTEILMWQKTVTGEVHWTAITDLLEHHHSQAVVQWERYAATLTNLETRITHLDALVERIAALYERNQQ